MTDFLPPIAKLVFWAAVAAIISMESYRLLSPQKQIAQLKGALDQARRRVAEFNGELDEAWPHLRQMLSLAFRRVAAVLPATLIASLPLLIFIVWLDANYGGTFPPPGTPISVQVPGEFQARWVDDGTGAPPRAEVLDPDGAAVAEVPVPVPVSIIHKRRWWNALVANPAGYLADALPIDRVEFALPRQEILSIGPGWMRGWEVTFFATLVLFALILKTVRRIE
ncbi:hypothetical protein [Rhodoligotrophos defluvii]|uniref:hypothetical protein n=1 Tax=Rhodoligotrophos defluvii TaxID=2561934 RepID=UPI0010C9F2C7|nr:hypothetical protein [Rhodoligotrophos defluvii]